MNHFRQLACVCQNRRGLSLIEVLVTISVIGLLLALVLPAVQSVRESQRRQVCQSRLYEIGRAMQAFEGLNQSYPSALAADEQIGTKKQTKSTVRYIAPQVRLLPFLNQAAVFEQLNLQQKPIMPPWDEGFARRVFLKEPGNLNATKARIPAFLCPSDYTTSERFPGNNFRCNLGPGPAATYVKDQTRGGMGAFAALSTFGHQDFLDGSAQTIGWSERRHGSWQDGVFNPQIDTWYSNLATLLGRGPTLNEIAPVCASLTDQPGQFYPHGGGFWFFATYDHTWYNHGQLPNSQTGGCSSNASQHTMSVAMDGIYGANSNHAGGVNCVYMDGHTGFVNQNIELSVWRALSTRKGLDQVETF